MSKHIYIYSPSGAVRDKASFRRGVKRLTAMGHRVEVDEAALASHLRFAGDDATRLAAIHRAAASGADVALVSRGGYGLTRLLDGIHYKQVARAIDKGMLFVGLSDFTAFQNAVLARTGGVTWAGPSLGEAFGMAPPAQPDEIMAACFDDLLNGQGEGAGWRQPAVSENFSLLGTPYFPKIKGGLLFLEDVAEHPYRIERMLSQLLHAGVLGRQRAVILGQFTDYKLTPHDRGYKLATVVDWLRSQLKVPVLTNLPFGHVPTKVLLPVGAKAQLLVEGRDAMLYWG
jgi:muramoyltetrapeptide carboxypeptidase